MYKNLKPILTGTMLLLIATSYLNAAAATRTPRTTPIIEEITVLVAAYQQLLNENREESADTRQKKDQAKAQLLLQLNRYAITTPSMEHAERIAIKRYIGAIAQRFEFSVGRNRDDECDIFIQSLKDENVVRPQSGRRKRIAAVVIGALVVAFGGGYAMGSDHAEVVPACEICKPFEAMHIDCPTVPATCPDIAPVTCATYSEATPCVANEALCQDFIREAQTRTLHIFPSGLHGMNDCRAAFRDGVNSHCKPCKPCTLSEYLRS